MVAPTATERSARRQHRGRRAFPDAPRAVPGYMSGSSFTVTAPVSHFGLLVGWSCETKNATSSGPAMPDAAVQAALETFACIVRERHPGVQVLPLRASGRMGPLSRPRRGRSSGPSPRQRIVTRSPSGTCQCARVTMTASMELPRMRRRSGSEGPHRTR